MKTKTNKVPDSGWKCCKIGHEKFIKKFKKEVTAHYNFIKKKKGVDDVYKYTEGSGKLREDLKNLMFFFDLNELIDEAPLLEDVYTVYRMGPPFSDISLYTKRGEYIKDSKTRNLEIGDIFTEKKNWVDLGTSILSATYDKNYPLADFSLGITNDEIITMNSIKKYINLMKKDTFYFHSYFNTEKEYNDYKNIIKELYDTFLKEIKEWRRLEYQVDDSILFHDINEVGEKIVSRIYKKLYKNIYKAHFLSKIAKIKSCCFFKIKLKNKKGLFIERVSKYPQQREILIPNGTRFKVTNISVENYGVIDTSKIFKHIKKEEDEEEEEDDDPFSMISEGPISIRDLTVDMFHGKEGFISDSADLRQFKNISDNLPVKIKKIKVYEIETC
jgi:hypothetical protein